MKTNVTIRRKTAGLPSSRKGRNPSQPNPLTEEEKALIKSIYKYTTVKQISLRLHRAPSRVYTFMQEENLPTYGTGFRKERKVTAVAEGCFDFNDKKMFI